MLVIDASVVAKWVLEYEQDTEKAFIILEKHKSSVDEIIVPDLIFYEIANMLATKSRMKLKEVLTALSKIYQANLSVYHPLEVDINEATKLARKYKTSVYDMLYAVVAKIHKANLVTADGQFARQTKFKFVRLL